MCNKLLGSLQASLCTTNLCTVEENNSAALTTLLTEHDTGAICPVSIWANLLLPFAHLCLVSSGYLANMT